MSAHELVGGSCHKCGVLSQHARGDCPGAAPLPRAAMPHCDSRVLHAKGECRHCDEYPEWQAAREAWGINFTGKSEPGKLPCPSEQARALETIEQWPGNRPAPVARKFNEVPVGTKDTRVTPISAGLVDDRAQLDTGLLANGQQRTYLVLSAEERSKGYVRPVRTSYKHVGIPGPRFELRDLTDDERSRFGGEKYVKFEPYPPGFRGSATGRFWTQEELDKVGRGCGRTTTMARPIAETYAREPYFYGSTMCTHCRTHWPVGERGEFVWIDEVTGQVTDERVGT